MNLIHRRGLVIGMASLIGLASAVVGSTPAGAAPPGPGITTVLSGLNAPRGLAFDGGGNLYSVQSGVAGAGASGITRTGKVSKYRPGSTVPTWTTTFESVYLTVDPTQPPDVLGPEGISVGGKNCGEGGEKREDRNAGKGDDTGRCKVMLIMSESQTGVTAATKGAVSASQAGMLFQLNPDNGKATGKSNVGNQNYAFTEAHAALFPSDFPDSNPYGVLAAGGGDRGVRTFVADAGSNLVSEVMPNGRVRNIAYIPNESAPPFRDATPTCIAKGPDGMLYVATLHFVANLFVFGSGQSMSGGSIRMQIIRPLRSCGQAA